jgi:hypothetical protein
LVEREKGRAEVRLCVAGIKTQVKHCLTLSRELEQEAEAVAGRRRKGSGPPLFTILGIQKLLGSDTFQKA